MIKKIIIILIISSSAIYGYERRVQLNSRYSVYQGIINNYNEEDGIKKFNKWINSNYDWGFGISSFWISPNVAFPSADFRFTKLEKEDYLFKSKDINREQIKSYDFYIGLEYYFLNFESRNGLLSFFSGIKGGIVNKKYNDKDILNNPEQDKLIYPGIFSLGLCFELYHFIVKYYGIIDYHYENSPAGHFINWGEFISVGLSF